MAKIFDKVVPGPSEHVLIMAVREAFSQPFEATDWTDLRVGFFLSICGNADPGEDDTITGLAEDIGANDATPIPWTDRVSIGVTGGTGANDFVFCGYTNAGTGRIDPSFGRSRLLSSDNAVGTTNADYWRPTNGRSNKYTVQIIQNTITRASSTFGSQPHFVQNFSGGHAAGYSTLLGLRFTRPDARGRAKIITMQVKKATSGDNSDLLFSSDPSTASMESQLQAFPTTVQTLGPVELNHLPDRFHLYWPFSNSRLRCHAAGILKVA